VGPLRQWSQCAARSAAAIFDHADAPADPIGNASASVICNPGHPSALKTLPEARADGVLRVSADSGAHAEF
jgi:hypothetical protein